MTDIDTATGLPALPEGFYWQVAPSYKGSDYLEIRIIRKSNSFWRPDREVENGVVRKEDASPGTILRSATYAFERFQKYDFDNNWQKYTGNYPPKSF